MIVFPICQTLVSLREYLPCTCFLPREGSFDLIGHWLLMGSISVPTWMPYTY